MIGVSLCMADHSVNVAKGRSVLGLAPRRLWVTSCRVWVPRASRWRRRLHQIGRSHMMRHLRRRQLGCTGHPAAAQRRGHCRARVIRRRLGSEWRSRICLTRETGSRSLDCHGRRWRWQRVDGCASADVAALFRTARRILLRSRKIACTPTCAHRARDSRRSPVSW
jgi:hypothetical protein